MKAESGGAAERKAERYLRRQGLKPVERNYRTPRGEIDLIMRQGDELVFIEVRQRRDSRYGTAAASVRTPKQRRIVAAASQYLQRHGEAPARFDVVAFDGDTGPEWITDAFTAD